LKYRRYTRRQKPEVREQIHKKTEVRGQKTDWNRKGLRVKMEVWESVIWKSDF